MESTNIRVLTASDMAVISQNIAQIRNTIPSVKPLSSLEKRALFKLSNNRIDFVEEAFNKMKSNPSLVPAYVDITAAQKLLYLYRQMTEISEELKKVQEQLDNTRLQAGNQAMILSKMFYHQTKNAATLGLKDASAITDHLQSLYTVGRNAKKKKAAKKQP